MYPPCELLEWDSRFFGITVGRVTTDAIDATAADAIDDWCIGNDVTCLYFMARADARDTCQVAQAKNYSLVDVRLDFQLKLTNSMQVSAISEGVRGALPEDLPVLEHIARHSFTDSRFYFDGHFSREQCDRLYETWIKESCRGWAASVRVLAHESVPLAFATCDIKHTDSGPIARIGLVGVAPNVRGRGFGAQIVSAAIDWFRARDLKQVRVVTQGRNVAAQRLYQQCGFRTADVHLYYHKWFLNG